MSELERIALDVDEIRHYIANPSSYCDYFGTTPSGMAEYVSRIVKRIRDMERPASLTPADSKGTSGELGEVAE